VPDRGRVSRSVLEDVGSSPGPVTARRPVVSHASQLVTAATPPAGVDEDEDNNENSEGDEPSADPERLARERHVLTSFVYEYGGCGSAVVKAC
jgi:hypothetical protein